MKFKVESCTDRVRETTILRGYSVTTKIGQTLAIRRECPGNQLTGLHNMVTTRLSNGVLILSCTKCNYQFSDSRKITLSNKNNQVPKFYGLVASTTGVRIRKG